MENLFDIPKKEYVFLHKVEKLRKRISDRTEELGIRPDHDEFGHWYKFGDKRYASVTGRLTLLKDPSIGLWRVNRVVDYIRKNFTEFTEETIHYHLEQAKNVPQLEFEGAGSLGTAVHDWREAVFSKVLEGHPWEEAWKVPVPDQTFRLDPRFISACRAIKKFVEENNYQPVACELYVADHKLETGGQVDDIGFVNGTLTLVDLKTSNQGDKESYYAQVALYMHMFRQLYKIRPPRLCILHVSKTDGTYKLLEIRDIPETIKWAKKVVEVGQGLERIKESKKKQVINL